MVSSFVFDRAVWHQADPISKGTRWALVIFYDVQTNIIPPVGDAGLPAKNEAGKDS